MREAERVEAPVIGFDCAALLKELRGHDSFRDGDHAAMTVAKREELRFVLIAFHAGGRLDEHSAAAPVIIHGVEGSVTVHVGGEEHEVRPGGVLFLAEGLPHSVTASDESAVLLTIGGLHPHPWPPVSAS